MTKKLLFLFVLSISILACPDQDVAGPFENSELALKLAHAEQAPDITNFLQMSDTQFGMLAKPLIFLALSLTWMDGEFEKEMQHFQKAIDFAKSTNPQFVIICGDLVNRRRHEGQMNAFKRMSASLREDVTLYLVPGNHDVDNEPTPESIATYRSNFGDDRYVFREKDILGIVLNSTLIASPTLAMDEEARQQAWVAEELKKAQQLKINGEVKHIFVFQHHPYWVEDPDEESHEGNIDLPQRKYYLDLFHAHDVDAVLTGHFHRNMIHEYEAIDYITTGAIGLPAPFDETRSGFRVLRTDPNGLQHAYIGLNALPN